MNSINRYYLSRSQWGSDLLSLTGDEAHHCVRVLRQQVGDVIEVFDGEGRVAQGEIVSSEKSAVSLKVIEVLEQDVPSPKIKLMQAIPKGSNMEWIIQKAVELGVHEIQPLITENTVVKPDQLEKKAAKWQKVALEACKQCGQNHLPHVNLPLKWSDWVKSIDEYAEQGDALSLVAALDPRSEPIKQVVSVRSLREEKNQRMLTVSILVGPEGDFSLSEYDDVINRGYLPVSIGDIVLKVETATMFCLSAVQYEFR